MKEQETSDRESKANHVQAPSRGKGEETAGPKSSVAPLPAIGEDTLIVSREETFGGTPSNLAAVADFIYERYRLLALVDGGDGGDGSHFRWIVMDAEATALGSPKVSDLFPLCERVEAVMTAHYGLLVGRNASGSDGLRLSDKVVQECVDRDLLFVFGPNGCTVLDDITEMAASMQGQTLVGLVMPNCDWSLDDHIFVDKLAPALVEEWQARQKAATL